MRVPVSWEFANPKIRGHHDFEVVVKPEGNGDRKETIQRVSGSLSTTLSFLKPGKFTWYVREVAQLARVMDESSENQVLQSSRKSNLTITTNDGYFRSMHETGLRGALARQIKSGGAATIFFEQLP